jgi:hypothetical protein
VLELLLFGFSRSWNGLKKGYGCLNVFGSAVWRIGMVRNVGHVSEAESLTVLLEIGFNSRIIEKKI